MQNPSQNATTLPNSPPESPKKKKKKAKKKKKKKKNSNENKIKESRRSWFEGFDFPHNFFPRFLPNKRKNKDE